jgi:hypothetical protein
MPDIFDAPDNTALDATTDYLAALVGEDKKFKDVSALARGKAEADAYIATLTKSLDELRDELKTRETAGSILDQLKSLQQNPGANVPPVIPDPPERKVLTPEELEAMLDRRLTEREARDLAKSNREAVQADLVKKYGSVEAVQAEVARKAKELDIKPEIMKQMAEQSPKAFAALFSPKSAPPSPPRSGVNTSAQSYSPTGERRQSYWDDLKKADRAAYFSKELTIQRHNDAMRLGETFFDI